MDCSGDSAGRAAPGVGRTRRDQLPRRSDHPQRCLFLRARPPGPRTVTTRALRTSRSGTNPRYVALESRRRACRLAPTSREYLATEDRQCATSADERPVTIAIPRSRFRSQGDAATGTAWPRYSCTAAPSYRTPDRIGREPCFDCATGMPGVMPTALQCAARATLRSAAFAVSWLARGPRRSRVPRIPRLSPPPATCSSGDQSRTAAQAGCVQRFP